MKKSIRLSLLVSLLLALTVGVLHAQDDHGFIQGRIYKDVNGDGRCVDTGVPGEEPIPNVNVQFTNSDRDLVITHYSGPEGIFGLVRAGFSYWEVTVLPPPGWFVTSQQTIYVPVYEDTLSHDNVNFCLSQGTVGQARVVALLPQSGAGANSGLTIAAVFGFILLVSGIGIEIRRRRAYT